MFWLLTAFVILPNFNHSKDFFIFARWSLFNSKPRKVVYDITWDEGESFLFRDHRKKAHSLGVHTFTLFYLMMNKQYNRNWASQEFGRIQKDHLENLKKVGPCEKLQVVDLKGSLYQHIILKEDLEMVESTPLCDD